MIAFDSDVVSDLLLGNASMQTRAALIPRDQQTVPVVVLEEVMRGWLALIRRAESRKGGVDIETAYERLQRTFVQLRRVTILPYDRAAHDVYKNWVSQKICVGTHDLRIAAIYVSQSATLVTRNVRDFRLVPGLDVDNWS